MLRQIIIQNFRSFTKATLPLSDVTVLLGPNASGKSNAIEAIRFLVWLAKGRRLEDIFADVRDAELAIRGTLTDLGFRGQSAFNLGCVVQSSLPWNKLEVGISVTEDGLRIVSESIDVADESNRPSTFPLYRIEKPADSYTHEIQVAYNNFAQGGKKPHVACNDNQAVFTQLTSSARFGSGHKRAQKDIPAATDLFRTHLGRVVFLDPIPSRMRGYSFIADKNLQEDGSNVSSALYELRRQGRQQEVLDFIRALPEQDIRDIDFLKTQRGEVLVSLTESFGHTTEARDASVLSDGTMRVLGIAAALLSAQQGSLVVIEEIDNGVHPSRARELLAHIEAAVKRRGVQVLLTTHNPALMDALPLQAVPNVVYAHRDMQNGDSRLVRLEDLPNYPELMAQGTLGHLVTKGVLERSLQESPNEKLTTNLEWLERYKRSLEGQVR